MAMCNEAMVGDVRKRIEECLALLDEFDFFIDAYVLNFFVENHWESVREDWRSSLAAMTLRNMYLSPPSKDDELKVLDSLLKLRKKVHRLSIDSVPIQTSEKISDFLAKQCPQGMRPKMGRKSLENLDWKMFPEEGPRQPSDGQDASPRFPEARQAEETA